MRGPKPETLNLSEAEQNELKALVHRHTTPQQHALRGRMILAAADGKNNSQMACELKVCVDTVRAWRGRWLELQAIPLADPERDKQIKEICGVYHEAPGRTEQGERTVSTDELTGVLALERKHPGLPLVPGKVERRAPRPISSPMSRPWSTLLLRSSAGISPATS